MKDIDVKKVLQLADKYYFEKDYKKAKKYYEISANKGDSYSMCVIGIMYEDGEGVIQNCKTAIYWYKLAALSGSVDAMYNLAFIYEKLSKYDENTEKNKKESFFWYQTASKSEIEHNFFETQEKNVNFLVKL